MRDEGSGFNFHRDHRDRDRTYHDKNDIVKNGIDNDHDDDIIIIKINRVDHDHHDHDKNNSIENGVVRYKIKYLYNIIGNGVGIDDIENYNDKNNVDKIVIIENGVNVGADKNSNIEIDDAKTIINGNGVDNEENNIDINHDKFIFIESNQRDDFDAYAACKRNGLWFI